jgi:hypothetical protein
MSEVWRSPEAVSEASRPLPAAPASPPQALVIAPAPEHTAAAFSTMRKEDESSADMCVDEDEPMAEVEDALATMNVSRESDSET